MPLEVRQIGIRMEVAGSGGEAPRGEASSRSGAVDLLRARGRGSDEAERAALIEQCVAAVLAELERRAER